MMRLISGSHPNVRALKKLQNSNPGTYSIVDLCEVGVIRDGNIFECANNELIVYVE